MRAEEFKKMSAQQVQSSLVFFWSLGNELYKSIQLSSMEMLKEMKNGITTESFAEKWGWFGVMYRLTNGEIVNLERITNLSLLECLTWLSYETDLDSQNKVKLNDSK
jgi:hypothetical protein